jgi:hypothetical protein
MVLPAMLQVWSICAASADCNDVGEGRRASGEGTHTAGERGYIVSMGGCAAGSGGRGLGASLPRARGWHCTDPSFVCFYFFFYMRGSIEPAGWCDLSQSNVHEPEGCEVYSLQRSLNADLKLLQ